jgi:endo-1,4-beta-xylanase
MPRLPMSRLTIAGLLALAVAAPAAHAQDADPGCVAGPAAPARASRTPVRAPAAPAALKTVFRDAFLVGTALNADQFSERDTLGAALVTAQFNAITPENVLKWECVHPRPGTYSWSGPDRYVDFGTRRGMFVVGHTLVWHSQVPRWVFQDAAGQPIGRDSLLARMRDHIHTVVGRYKGRIKGWDVVNEALNEDGTLRDSPWRRIIGDDFIAKAFQYAAEADPAAELYYNDYSLENPAKRDGAVRLVKSLQAAGVKVSGIGTQEHQKLDWPSPALVDSMITAFHALGVQVHVTELDIDVLPRATRNLGADVSMRAQAEAALNPYAAGLPDSAQAALTKRYGELFAVYMKHKDAIGRVTFWGVRDGDSWLNNWPVRGRTSYPLLFDRQGKPKPAFDAVVRTARTPFTS